ncbi:MAG: YihA family ribosome biogenesis GTP-binding protein [Rickettsiales bacterium]|nr:YihA family ribosome biogenesis GTP-binding protein [Rickettsiales bacterium]
MIKGGSESWKFLKEVYDSKNLPFDSIAEFVFWGRSNVGKSSLINSLTNTNLAKISRTPGRTKSLIFYEFEKKIRFVDFPGYGFSKIPKKERNDLDLLINFYFEKRENIKKIFLLIDSRHGFKSIDKVIFQNLEKIFSNKICLILTKIDKKKKNENLNELIPDNIRSNFQIKKNLFTTSIKEVNGIILLKKFLFNSL